MPKLTGEPRKLSYPLKDAKSIQSDIYENLPIVLNPDSHFPLDSDQRIDIVLYVSLNEYVEIAASVDVGRDIAFGDDSVALWEIWSRAFVSDLCSRILECIETTPEIQEAISTYASTSNIDGNSTEVASNLESALVNNPVGCDNDIIFGMTRQLVEFADRLIKDLFEQIDSSQLTSTNVGYIIKLIPVLETLPFDELFQLTDKLVDDLETAYLGASTQLLKDEIACDLFCIAQLNGCTLTLEQVRDYFQEKANVVFSYTSVLAFATDFIDGTFVGNAVYYALNILFFQIFAFGGKWLDYLFSDYLKVINSMYNDPDSDWSTLCDDCGWQAILDFTSDDYGIVFFTDSDSSPIGQWTNGVGIEVTDIRQGTSYRRQLYCSLPCDETQIYDVTLIGSFTKGQVSAGNVTAVFHQLRNNGTPIALTYTDMLYSEFTLGNPTPVNLNGTYADQTSDDVLLYMRSSIQETMAFSGYGKITSVIIRGHGTKPSQFP